MPIADDRGFDGDSLKRDGRFHAAARAYLRDRTSRDDAAELARLLNLSDCLLQLRRIAWAKALLARLCRRFPGSAVAQERLARVLWSSDDTAGAVAAVERALALDPRSARSLGLYGLVLAASGRLDAAARAFREAVALEGDDAISLINLGSVLTRLDRIDEAVALLKPAIPHLSTHADFWRTLADALLQSGRVREALQCALSAVGRRPMDPDLQSLVLFTLNYTDSTPNQLAVQHAERMRRLSGAVPKLAPGVATTGGVGRIRIGFVSPDFRQHSIASFIPAFLRHYDRARFEVHLFHLHHVEDDVSARMRADCDHWHAIHADTPARAAERIRDAGIQVLVDLAGHGGHNGLAIFMHRPAPVQITWMGYPNTTGLPEMDYRIVDAVTDPPGRSEAFCSETLLRIESGFLCYDPPRVAPEPGPPPCLTSDGVTFGSFNVLPKVSGATLDLWAACMRAVPNARLLLKSKGYASADGCARLVEDFDRRGIAAERIDMMGWVADRTAHFALYDRIDIALDTIPYNGTTTTCEALWMGVPVVVLVGADHRARVGASLLTHAGLTDWIAATPDAYVDRVAALADDRAALAAFRAGARSRLAGSALCDARTHAAAIGALFADKAGEGAALSTGISDGPDASSALYL